MISFVVPAHNEERLLDATLCALHAAARSLGEPYELVVADDASTDRTAALAQAHGATLVQVAHRQIAATRNAGARAAQGEWLVFVDADTLVTPAVVQAAVRALRAGAVGGGAAVAFDGEVPAYAGRMTPWLMRIFRLARLAAGCFVYCTREAFVAVGGFDERYSGAEEIVISRALGKRGRFVILREAVITSGRKLRAYAPREVLAIAAALALRGPAAVRRREGLESWYGQRREDPASATRTEPR
jgi:glycosyltransferase involved in cell wall biosynthesis